MQMKTYRFYKNGKEWFIDLPEYVEHGGSIGDLQMVDGADTMLDIIAGKENAVELTVSKEPFERADILILKEKCDVDIGGGYYFMKQYQGKELNQTMWLCQVTAFVFDDIPQQIFVRKEK